jgi:hypothetical protein
MVISKLYNVRAGHDASGFLERGNRREEKPSREGDETDEEHHRARQRAKKWRA